MLRSRYLTVDDDDDDGHSSGNDYGNMMDSGDYSDGEGTGVDDVVQHPSSEYTDDVDEFGHGINSGDENIDDTVMDSIDSELIHHTHDTPIVPSKVLDTKAKILPTKTGYMGMTDAFGTGELFADESSTAALLAVLGLLLVSIVAFIVYMTFRQTMTDNHSASGSSVVTTKKGTDNVSSTTKVNTSSSTLYKRRE